MTTSSKTLLLARRLAVLLPLAALLAPLAAHADAHGKQAFLDAQCDRCHGVDTVGIRAKKPRASDLSHAGAERDAGWIRDYLLRKVLLDDNQHPVAWKGSDAQLDAVVAWLASLE
jgi:mono/diheme cytochrome c family protein